MQFEFAVNMICSFNDCHHQSKNQFLDWSRTPPTSFSRRPPILSIPVARKLISFMVIITTYAIVASLPIEICSKDITDRPNKNNSKKKKCTPTSSSLIVAYVVDGPVEHIKELCSLRRTPPFALTEAWVWVDWDGVCVGRRIHRKLTE